MASLSLSAVVASLAVLTIPASAQVRITRSINEGQLQTLVGQKHPLARPEFDSGAAPADLSMDRMLLMLSRSAAQETTLEKFLTDLQDQNSPSYHKWLTPQQFGQQFGAADQDIQTITWWLESHGFTVNRVYNGKSVIEFSGTAVEVREAFHTEIHKYVVNGQEHWANSSDPQIPEALTPVVTGVVTLHNFAKKSQLISSHQRFEATWRRGTRAQFTGSNGVYALAPDDYDIIYDITPEPPWGFFSDSKLAVVARSNINTSDIQQFSQIFGTARAQIVLNGPDPGDLGGGEEAEAVLDSSWAAAIAGAYTTTMLVVSKSTNASDGTDLSELYIIDNNLADVMTESFGDCEANYSQAVANYYSSVAQQAAAQGITYLVAAGDSGAEGCDAPTEGSATGPLSVNILSSNPYVIAVGGTEFNENGNYSQYWSSTNNGLLGSALSYIPEVVWNESCTAAGGANPCPAGTSPGLWAGGGGASMFFAKPAWQEGFPGVPNDGARDVPDVALTAAGHDAYLLCIDGSCTPDSRGLIYFEGYGGTSAATPSFAGIMATIVTGQGRQGQANPILYSLESTEALSSCNASNNIVPSAGCAFHDVTQGNNAVPGEAGYNTSGGSYQAAVGYDLATGLGSVDGQNLMKKWPDITSELSGDTAWFINIHQPGSSVAGMEIFSGTAIAPFGVIAVQLSIDNVPYGFANVQGTAINTVNWSLPVDTTHLSNGYHTLDVIVMESGWDHASARTQFNVANWTTADSIIVDIDNPSANSGPVTGFVGFGGWAIDIGGVISNVLISIDGVSRGNGYYGYPRPDVCANYPNLPAIPSVCTNVGWNFGLDTTTLADGSHTLAVTGQTSSGQNTTVSRTFTTSNLSASPISVFIDLPNAKSLPYSGPSVFAGWAIDNNIGVAISTIAISVDGAFLRNAIYGAGRPDVCTAFPGRTGCPNVGWSVVIDTTTLANGVHTVEVEATDATGVHATTSSQFTVANPTSGLPIKAYIDVPSAQSSTVTGSITFAGWALDDNAAITSVSISIDGAPNGNATYGSGRPDVCTAYPGRPGCPNVGWSLVVDTTLIPNGAHTVAATATAANGDTLTVSNTFTVANWTGYNPIHINIDSPNPQSPAFSGSAGFGGWAISDSAAITSVAIAIDGVPYGNGSYGFGRPDVCAAYPGRAGCPNVGWNFGVDTTLLANGGHTLDVTAISSAGQSFTTSTSFNVSNSSGALLVNIDAPATDALLNSQVQTFGWAIDTNTGVTVGQVEILVDGVFIANANYGDSRPDVCAAYPGLTCSGGWDYMLDPTLFASGAHTLEVRATTNTGQHATTTRTFITEEQ